MKICQVIKYCLKSHQILLNWKKKFNLCNACIQMELRQVQKMILYPPKLITFTVNCTNSHLFINGKLVQFGNINTIWEV